MNRGGESFNSFLICAYICISTTELINVLTRNLTKRVTKCLSGFRDLSVKNLDEVDNNIVRVN